MRFTHKKIDAAPRDYQRETWFGFWILAAIVGAVIFCAIRNEMTDAYPKAVERMHRETAR